MKLFKDTLHETAGFFTPFVLAKYRFYLNQVSLDYYYMVNG